MFGTFIIEAYRKEETMDMVNVIDNLCYSKYNYVISHL